MAEAQKPLDTLLDLGKIWAGIAALVTVVLYVLGYLSLRSHYSAFGIDVDLGVFDNRYSFAGARFLVFALTTLASWTIPLLVLAVGWLAIRPVGALFVRLMPDWLTVGLRLILLGLLAYATIAASQALLIHDLLLNRQLPGSWASDKLVCWLAADPKVGGPSLAITFKLL